MPVLPVLAGVGALGAAGLAWGLAEAHAFTTRHVRVPVLEPESEPIRVLHVSDLHLTPRQRDKVAWVRSLASLEPDLVVNTGDNIAHRDAVPGLLRALEPLLQRPGVFVNGSNDYFAPGPKNPFAYFWGPSGAAPTPKALPTEQMTRGFVAAGWRDLNDARATVRIKGVHFDLVGVDDPHIRRDHMPPPAPRDPQALRVAVAHAPYRRVLEAFVSDGARLMLAGHTHGGQVCMPGVGALVTNCDLDRGRAKGLSGWPGSPPGTVGGEESVWLHVSAGAGTSPYAPVRFACRPEATLLTLVPKEGFDSPQ